MGDLQSIADVQPGVPGGIAEHCCWTVIESTVERALNDFSDGAADPEIVAYVSFMVYTALRVHTHTNQNSHGTPCA